MTNYSDTPGMVRVDYFKASGKWYMTEACDMSEFWDHGISPHDAIEAALRKSGRWLLRYRARSLEEAHKSIEEENRGFTLTPKRIIFRRRKAGPWEEVERGG